MSFRQLERTCQLNWKRATNAVSQEARRPGLYSGDEGQERTADEMFLSDKYAHENLFPWIRLPALRIFEAKDIDWHEGATPRQPSNYLLDSMVSCVNCLFPFAFDSHALAKLFRPIVPDAVDAVVIEDGLFLTHEWLGAENYLRETSPGRKRGAKGTSIAGSENSSRSLSGNSGRSPGETPSGNTAARGAKKRPGRGKGCTT